MTCFSHYSHRSFLPPATTSLRLVNESSKVAIHALFPVAQISVAVSVEILEPKYFDHVRQHQSRLSISNDKSLADYPPLAYDLGEYSEKTICKKSHCDSHNFRVFADVRDYSTLASLLQALLSPATGAYPFVRITNISPALSRGNDYLIPHFLNKVNPCDQARTKLECQDTCRYGRKRVRTFGEWPSLNDLGVERAYTVEAEEFV